ncbi:sugar phosphate isomerase/epimerase family protein [Schumannella luteola]
MSAPLSVQLYTLRGAIEHDLEGTLSRLADHGVAEVELFRFPERAAEYTIALERLGLRAPTVHARLVTGGADVDGILGAATEIGATTVIDPYIPAECWTSWDDVRRIADELASVGERAAAHGLAVGYHNHWWETEYRIDDEPALEALASILDPGIQLEVDIYWALVGGVDPVGLLERLGDRVTALHVKDGSLAKDASGQAALGSGVVPVAGCLRAAPHARRVVELDHVDGDVWEPVLAGVDFVRQADAT